MTLLHVPVAPIAPDRFEKVLLPEQVARLRQTITQARSVFSGRVVWNVNSTGSGGGVAELLRSLIAYAGGADVDARWVVIDGDAEFFRLTKRLHNQLHGFPGDSDPLGSDARRVYESVTSANATELLELIKPGDVVLLHDPQTAGLVRPLRKGGARVVWRCHVGLDEPNDLAREAWRFLRPYMADAEAYVFSRGGFVWEGLDAAKVAIIAPSIDAFSPKNEELDPATVEAILTAAGVVASGQDSNAVFQREDGSPGRIDRRADVIRDSPLRPSDRLIVQVSRWDRLKDPLGVLEAFAWHLPHDDRLHLALAGPVTAAVSDDPEGAHVLDTVIARRLTLAPEVRRRVHLVSIPMDDAEENAAIVNALQRHAEVVVQKSLAEGFGLTVSEAMWKGRPVVAGRVGGIRDQIVDGQSGVLVDPTDLEAFGAAVTRLLADPRRAAQLGERARARVRDAFLGPRHLDQYVDLLRRTLGRGE